MTFFVITSPQKKRITHYCRLFFLKHREDKTHKKTTKNNQEKGGGVLLSSTLSLLALAFTLLFLPFCLKRFFLVAIFAFPLQTFSSFDNGVSAK
jgi:hypothetical protein